MKKLLLSLASVAVAMASYAVEPITADFASWEPFAEPKTVIDKTVEGVDYSFLGTYVSEAYSAGGSNYLMIRGKVDKDKGVEGAYFTAKLPFDCSKIEMTTTSGCSTNAASKINVYAGETVVSEGLAVNAHSETYTVVIPEANSAAGTVFKFESATIKYNQQFVKVVFYPVTAEPTLDVEFKSLDFAVAKGGQQAKSLKVMASNITGDITVASDNAAFKVAKASYTEAEAAEGVEISLESATPGTVDGVITFTAGNATATVNVSGYVAANEGTEANPLTVADIIGMNSLNGAEFYVTGTVNDLTAANAKDGKLATVASADKNAASNIVLKDGENLIGVKLPTANDIRATLNIVDNPDNVGKTVIIKGKPLAYFGAPGLDCTGYVSGLAGIADVAVDADAPVEYYNLQGVRMQGDMAPGLYIRRQGNQATKVLVK